MSEPRIATADAKDVHYFARRRSVDEHTHRFYIDLAAQAPNGAICAYDEGAPIGVTIAHASDDEWFLSEIFVEPSFRGQGIGYALLRAAAEGAGDVIRAGALSPSEPQGIAFYARQGVPVVCPLFEVSGPIPHDNEIARMAAGDYRFATEDLDAARHRSALAQLDREIRGSARPHDHAYFLQHAQGVLFRRVDEAAGYLYVWPDGRIGPMAAAAPAYQTPFFAFALAMLRKTGASWCKALLPGVNARLLRTTMIAGLDVGETVLFASDAGALDLSRYVAFHRLLV